MRPTRRKTQQRVALGVLASVVVAVVVACYGPTEVKLEITRDVSCPPRGEARTAIFVGRPGHGAIDPIAETEDCVDLTDGTFASSIGSLVVVPSDDRDARVTVEVAISLKPRGSGPNVPPKSPKDCLLDATDCIVARRSFAFIAHQSRVLPIKLSEECRDRTCLPGTTCIADNCRSDDADDEAFCDDRQSCNLPPRDGGTDAPIADAPVGDVLIDVDVVDAGVCKGRGDGIVVDGVPDPVGRILSTSTTLFWQLKTGRISSVRKDGTDLKTIYAQGIGNARITAFTVDASGALWVAESGRIYKGAQLSDGGAAYWAGPFGTSPINSIAATEKAVYWTIGTAEIVYGAATSPAPLMTAPLPADRLSARSDPTKSIVYGIQATNLRSFDGINAEIASFEGGIDVLAVDGGALIATKTEILSFTDGVAGTVKKSATVTPETLAENKGVVFWTESSPAIRIMRLDPATGGLAAALPIAGGHSLIRGLAVDDECVYYWVPDAIRVAPNK